MRLVTVLITLNDSGAITIDARGPVKGTEGLALLLSAAADLARDGKANIKLWKASTAGRGSYGGYPSMTICESTSQERSRKLSMRCGRRPDCRNSALTRSWKHNG